MLQVSWEVNLVLNFFVTTVQKEKHRTQWEHLVHFRIYLYGQEIVLLLCMLIYAPNNALQIGYEAAFLLNVDLAQRVSRNSKAKTVNPSSSVFAATVDDPTWNRS